MCWLGLPRPFLQWDHRFRMEKKRYQRARLQKALWGWEVECEEADEDEQDWAEVEEDEREGEQREREEEEEMEMGGIALREPGA